MRYTTTDWKVIAQDSLYEAIHFLLVVEHDSLATKIFVMCFFTVFILMVMTILLVILKLIKKMIQKDEEREKLKNEKKWNKSSDEGQKININRFAQHTLSGRQKELDNLVDHEHEEIKNVLNLNEHILTSIDEISSCKNMDKRHTVQVFPNLPTDKTRLFTKDPTAVTYKVNKQLKKAASNVSGTGTNWRRHTLSMKEKVGIGALSRRNACHSGDEEDKTRKEIDHAVQCRSRLKGICSYPLRSNENNEPGTSFKKRSLRRSATDDPKNNHRESIISRTGSIRKRFVEKMCKMKLDLDLNSNVLPEFDSRNNYDMTTGACINDADIDITDTNDISLHVLPACYHRPREDLVHICITGGAAVPAVALANPEFDRKNQTLVNFRKKFLRNQRQEWEMNGNSALQKTMKKMMRKFSSPSSCPSRSSRKARSVLGATSKIRLSIL